MNRLRSYRAIEGINQQQLGETLGLSAPMVSAIESGRRSFSGSLDRLGYADDRFTIPTMSTPMHRQRASTTVAATSRATELLRLAGEVFAALAQRTPGTPRVAIEPLPTPHTVEDLEEVAIDLRASLRHEESGPIKNLTSAVERAGVCIVPIVGLAGVDGISSWVEDIPVIGLNPSVPGDRFRLSLGHELAHLAVHKRKSEHTESEANRLAGALLFPLAEFDLAMPDRPTLRDFVNLKKTWGVSVAALVYRAHELGHIDDARYRSLQIQMSAWRRTEPATFDPVPGQLLRRLVEENGGLDAVAKQFGVNRKHLGELVGWARLRSVS